MEVEDVLILGWNELGDRLLDQLAHLQPQQIRGGQVGFEDASLFIDGAITKWRPVVQVRVVRPSCIQLFLGVAQFLVLHLQLNLVHPQFVDKTPVPFNRLGVDVLL
jgi:hypothetical protein